jgi:hypothetical protein
MASIYDLVQKMFTYYGFDFKGHIEEGYAVAHKGSIKVIIAMKRRYVDQSDMKFFADILVNEGAEKGIFIALTNFSDEAMKVADKHRILMWDRERFEGELGKVILAEAEGLKRDRGEELFEQVLGLFDIARLSKAAGKGKEGELGIDVEPMVTVSLVENEMILTPVVGLEAASTLGKRRIKHAFKYDLQLIPYYLFEYHVEFLDEEDGKPGEDHGTIGINALTEEPERWTRQASFTKKIDMAHTKLEPKITDEEAKRIVTDYVIDLSTRTMEYKEEKSHVTVFERKKVRPKEDAVKIAELGLIYLPVWGVVGTNGVVIIDATSGEVLKEDK